MSFNPLIQNKSFFQKPILKWFEMPFTPLINGVKHLQASVLKDPVFENGSLIRRAGHLALATLELGTVLEAAHLIYKHKKFFAQPGLLLLAAVTTTLFDAYLQSPTKIRVESLDTDSNIEVLTGALINPTPLEKGLLGNDRITQDSHNDHLSTGKALVYLTAAVTLTGNTSALKQALNITDTTTLPVALLERTEIFLLNDQRFVVIADPKDKKATGAVTAENLATIMTRTLTHLPAYVAPEQNVATKNFKIADGMERTYSKPNTNEVGAPTEITLDPKDDDIVLEGDITLVANVLDIGFSEFANASSFSIYFTTNYVIAKFVDSTTGQVKWRQTKIENHGLAKHNMWVSGDGNSFTVSTAPTVQSTGFIIAGGTDQKVFKMPDLTKARVPQEVTLNPSKKHHILHGDITLSSDNTVLNIGDASGFKDYAWEIYFTDDFVIAQFTDDATKAVQWRQTKLEANGLAKHNMWERPDKKVNSVTVSTVAAPVLHTVEDTGFALPTDLKIKLHTTNLKATTEIAEVTDLVFTNAEDYGAEMKDNKVYLPKEIGMSWNTYQTYVAQDAIFFKCWYEKDDTQTGPAIWIQVPKDDPSSDLSSFNRLAILKGEKENFNVLEFSKVDDTESPKTSPKVVRQQDAKTWGDDTYIFPEDSTSVVNMLDPESFVTKSDMEAQLTGAGNYGNNDKLSFADVFSTKEDPRITLPKVEDEDVLEAMFLEGNNLLIKVGNGKVGYFAVLDTKGALAEYKMEPNLKVTDKIVFTLTKNVVDNSDLGSDSESVSSSQSNSSSGSSSSKSKSDDKSVSSSHSSSEAESEDEAIIIVDDDSNSDSDNDSSSSSSSASSSSSTSSITSPIQHVDSKSTSSKDLD